jgi:hypothetical protein
MHCLEVNYVSTSTDAAGVALTAYRTELQVPEFDRSLISFLERQRLFDFFFLTSDGNSTVIKKRRFISILHIVIVPLR